MVQGVATETEEDVGLILDRVDTPRDARATLAVSGHPGVVAGGDEVGPDLLAVGPELAELEPRVAEDAWVGRPSGRILVGEPIDDPGEVALEVEGIERDVEPVGDGSGVDGVGCAAAGLG